MVAAELRKGIWFVAANTMYLAAKNSNDIAPGVQAKVELTNWIITPVIGYNLVDVERGNLNILGGARYLYLDASLRVDALVERVRDDGQQPT